MTQPLNLDSQMGSLLIIIFPYIWAQTSPIMANLIVKLAISRPKFIFGCDVRHQEVHRVRHELAEPHGADCTALIKSGQD